MKEGFDVGMEMSGNPRALNNMIAHMNHAGKIALLGFQPNHTGIDWRLNSIEGSLSRCFGKVTIKID